jgi:hypothetical protein
MKSRYDIPVDSHFSLKSTDHPSHVWNPLFGIRFEEFDHPMVRLLCWLSISPLPELGMNLNRSEVAQEVVPLQSARLGCEIHLL